MFPFHRHFVSGLAACLLPVATPSWAADGLSTIVKACASTGAGFDAKIADLQAAGWVDADADVRTRLSQVLPVNTALFNHLDSSPTEIAEFYTTEVAIAQGLITKMSERSEPPYDTLQNALLAGPDGTAAVIDWTEIPSGERTKVYLSCRIATNDTTDHAMAASTIETAFTDPYLERENKTGANGERSNWTDYDNETLYVDTLRSSAISGTPFTLVQTIVQFEVTP